MSSQRRGRGRGQSNSNSSKTDPCWKYGTKVAPSNPNASYVYIRCKFCDQVVTGGVSRMKHHLAGDHVGAQPCPNVTEEAKKEMITIIQNRKQIKRRAEDVYDEKVETGAYFRSENQTGQQQLLDSTSFEVEKRSKIGVMDRFVTRINKDGEEIPPVQPREARKLVALDIGRFFFENGISFNVIESPSFVSMIRSVGQYGPGLKPPSRHELSTWILKEEVNTTSTFAEEIRKTWIQTGVSILSDGWKDMKGRSLINFLVNNPHGTIFLRCIDASDAVKDANMLFQLLDDIVEEVGEELVVQVVTDNASNYKLAGKKLMEKRQRLYWTPCAAHCIDLMLEKLGELPQHKNALLKAKEVSNFIYNHGFVLAMMRKFTNRELIRPATTRFATAFLTLESMLQSKQPLEAMFTSSEWANSTWAATSKGKKVKSIILSDRTFWPSVLYTLHSTRPLVKVLRMVDGEQMPAMGFIYGAIDEAKEEISKNFGGELGKYKEIWEIVDAKWENQLHREIHAAAYFLNPRYQYDPGFSNHHEIKKGLLNCMEKLIPVESLVKADLDLDSFKNKVGLFGCRQAQETYRHRAPANWWLQFGDEVPELQSFAVRVLSLTCSASACERNWSAFNQVHTKKRNRLSTKKLNDLVYIMYNKRLKDRHIKVKSRGGDIDPLEVDHLSSDDEWLVGNEEGESSDTFQRQRVNEDDFEAMFDEVQVTNEGTSSSSRSRGRGGHQGSKKAKKNTNARGKGTRSGFNLINEEWDEEEPEWSDVDEEEEDDFDLDSDNED